MDSVSKANARSRCGGLEGDERRASLGRRAVSRADRVLGGGPFRRQAPSGDSFAEGVFRRRGVGGGSRGGGLGLNDFRKPHEGGAFASSPKRKTLTLRRNATEQKQDQGRQERKHAKFSTPGGAAIYSSANGSYSSIGPLELTAA